MKDRIKQLMMSQHMTQQGFAEFLGVSPAALSSLFSGRSNPTLNYVDAIKISFCEIGLILPSSSKSNSQSCLKVDPIPPPVEAGNSAKLCVCTMR